MKKMLHFDALLSSVLLRFNSTFSTLRPTFCYQIWFKPHLYYFTGEIVVTTKRILRKNNTDGRCVYTTYNWG